MQRRSFLKTVPFFFSPSWGTDRVLPYLPIPRFIVTGRGEGKIILLFNYIQSALYSQVDPSKQTSIDCVSHAAGLGVEFVQAIQHFLRGDIWYGSIATEMLHAGTVMKICPKSRAQAGSVGQRRRRTQTKKVVNPKTSGITIRESILFLQQYGNLFRRKYGDFDFTNYDYNNVKQLFKGIPDHLLLECKKHPIQTVSQVTTWEEARDAIFELQPVVIGSAVGFDDAKRDKDGFAQPRGKWHHAWLLIGIKDRGRKGGCLISSHGRDWVKGPKSYGQPNGSIWVDKEVLHKMVNQYGDSYALADFK